jgi:hypothetical protein
MSPRISAISTAAGLFGSDPLAVDPGREVLGIEADVLADLEEGDATLGDEPTDEPRLDSEPRGHLLDIEKRDPTRATAAWVRTFLWW